MMSLISRVLSCFLFLHLALAAIDDPHTQVCSTDQNYTASSTYLSNINLLLASLTSNASRGSGYSAGSIGHDPDSLSGHVICRGDVSSADCSSCLGNASKGILQFCPGSKDAVLWYYNCLICYSNGNFCSYGSNAGKVIGLMQNITDHDRFDKLVNKLMNAVADWAAYNTSRFFATGLMNSTDVTPTIYALVQCGRDLSRGQCRQCLQGLIEEMPTSLDGKPEGLILGVQCFAAYLTFSFWAPPMIQLGSSAAPAPVMSPLLIPAAKQVKKKVTSTVIPIVATIATALVLSVIGIYLWRRSKRKEVLSYENSRDVIGDKSLHLDLSTLRIATENFSEINKLGQGGFGTVYKGILHDGQEIAVKKLSRGSGQGLGELKNELVLVAKLQHKNLVRLLGACLEDKLLVYEYVPNRSLDTILFDPEMSKQLDWGTRFRIIVGIARGLLYLHEDSQLKIIHRDLKASNILLDADMNPKISDFGLARLFGADQTQEITTRVAGTFGYMAPEYSTLGHFSIKSDVFSFGVLMLEIVTGKKNSGYFEYQQDEDLLTYIWTHWTNGTIAEVTELSIGKDYPTSEVLTCIHIGLLCVQKNPADRPSMSTVVLMLNGENLSLEAPSMPAFCIEKYNKSSSSIPLSLNEVSITEVEPR